MPHPIKGDGIVAFVVLRPGHRPSEELRREARQLAKYGVNLVRLHGPMFDRRGEVDLAKVHRALDVVEAMKAEGIYTHFSIYFPLWLDPPADLDWLPGYDGKSHAFASLYFNDRFQEKYRDWWRALLTTPRTGPGPVRPRPAPAARRPDRAVPAQTSTTRLPPGNRWSPGPPGPGPRVIRDGNYAAPPGYCRSGMRGFFTLLSGERSDYVGFRLAGEIRTAVEEWAGY